MVNILKIVSVTIGGLIGAGFASGQEIYLFFYQYGIKGLLGLLLCSELISYIVYKVLKLIKANNINNYKEFVNFIVNSKKKHTSTVFIINTIVNIFLLITFYIMIAGFGAYFSQELGVSSYIGSGILAFLCYVSLMKNASGVVKINAFLIPLLIVLITIIGVINFNTINLQTIGENIIQINKGNWILSSLLYCSYNSILLIPILMTLNKYLKSKRQLAIASAISGIITFIVAVVIYFLLARININIATLEMPVVYAISKFFAGFKIVYAFIILASIYTTAISIGVSFLENITKDKKTYTHIAIFMCITSLLISGFGFSNLINLLYPIFGYLGFIQIFAIIINTKKFVT